MARRFIGWVIDGVIDVVALGLLAALLITLWGLILGVSTPRSEAVIPSSGTPVSWDVQSDRPQSGAPMASSVAERTDRRPNTRAIVPAHDPRHPRGVQAEAPMVKERAVGSAARTVVRHAARPLVNPPIRTRAIAATWQKGYAAGKASHMGSGFPASYLALPIGPGYRVRICGAGGCVTQTSNDAGPSLAMQRAGRVADLSRAVFTRVCGLPASAGLCPVSVTVLGR